MISIEINSLLFKAGEEIQRQTRQLSKWVNILGVKHCVIPRVLNLKGSTVRQHVCGRGLLERTLSVNPHPNSTHVNCACYDVRVVPCSRCHCLGHVSIGFLHGRNSCFLRLWNTDGVTVFRSLRSCILQGWLAAGWWSYQ